MKKRPRMLALPTQLQIFMKISRIGFPGNQVKIFVSWESASLTESESLFGPLKISTGKKLASRNSAYLWFMDLWCGSTLTRPLTITVSIEGLIDDEELESTILTVLTVFGDNLVIKINTYRGFQLTTPVLSIFQNWIQAIRSLRIKSRFLSNTVRIKL